MDLGALAEMGPVLLAVAALLACSAFFSGTEAAMFSLRRVDRQQMGQSGRSADKLVAQLIARPRRLIATVLIGNEIVNVSISSTMASIGERVFTGGELAVTILTTAVTLPLLLMFGEITPKSVALKTSAAWARAASRPLWLFGLLVTPIRLVVRSIANVILAPFGVTSDRPPGHGALGQDEFIALVDAGSAQGQVDARERRLIHKVFEFGDKTVAQVMVPAAEAFLLAFHLPLSQILREVSTRGLSRVPIYQRTRDNILGLLYAKDLVLLGTGLTASRRLGELLHEPLFVPRNMRLERLFHLFKEKKIHMAIVVDEYGKFVGLATMEDLLEELFGPIRDEKEVSARRQAGAASMTPASATSPATPPAPPAPLARRPEDPP
jgi:putative hemolysin